MIRYFDIRLKPDYKERIDNQSDRFFTKNSTLIEVLFELLEQGKIDESLVRDKILESKQ